MDEHIVLVNDDNEVMGTAPKIAAHTNATPLHRAFSLFLFNSNGELLLQQRSDSKKTWPGIWSNSCCGHPMLHERTEDAVRRRLSHELGIEGIEVVEVLPDYRYRAEMFGIVENELCPVFVAFTDNEPILNPHEVKAIQWIPWKEFVEKSNNSPDDYSVWCVEETQLLDKSELFKSLYEKYTA